MEGIYTSPSESSFKTKKEIERENILGSKIADIEPLCPEYIKKFFPFDHNRIIISWLPNCSPEKDLGPTYLDLHYSTDSGICNLHHIANEWSIEVGLDGEVIVEGEIPIEVQKVMLNFLNSSENSRTDSELIQVLHYKLEGIEILPTDLEH
jgi:hypothetical protein